MNRSKTFLMLAGVAACVAFAPSLAQAQNGEAVNADDILAPKTQPKQENAGQTTSATQSDLEKGLAEAKAENEDEAILEKKIALAKEMHQIRPTRTQVDSAVAGAAMSLPASERQNFIIMMKSRLNYNAIERISIDAMVDTYTLVELEAMVEYFSKPEAKSASAKVHSWAKAVNPHIVRMIDEAIMRIKTGQ